MITATATAQEGTMSRYLATAAADVKVGDVIKVRARKNGRLQRQALTYLVTRVTPGGGYVGINMLLGGYRRFRAEDLIAVQIPN